MTDRDIGQAIRWWRYTKYQWEENDTGAWIQPAPGARLSEFFLRPNGDNWQSALDLAASLISKPMPFGLPSEHSMDRQVVLDWCMQYGLPGAGMADALEIVLPAVEAEGDAERPWVETFEQVSHLRVGAFWETRRTTWDVDRLDDRAGVEPTPLLPQHGLVRIVPPGSSSADVMQLSTMKRLFPRADLSALPRPLTEASWAQYVEPETVFVAALQRFRNAVESLVLKEDISALSSYLAGASWCAIPRSRPLPRSKWHAGWQVSSLFAAFAIQVLLLHADARLVECQRCSRTIPARHRMKKWCSPRCAEAGRKQEQRKRARSKREKDTARRPNRR